MRSILVLFTFVCLALTTPISLADVAGKLKAAMSDPARSDADKARDANRKPIETLAFFGLKEDMRVLELIPGGGWYTRLLAAAVADEGQLLVAVGTQGVEQKIANGEFPGVEVVEVEQASFGRPEGSRRYRIEGLKLNTKNIDLALTFRNLHNFDEDSRQQLNSEAFRVLKRGGLYGVVDHTRRHMQSDNQENWRRMDPVLMIKEIEAAGFEFVDFSDLHYRADDELIYEVGRRSVTGNTDRFTLLFRKP
jgi:predicted methyltransferase